MKFTMEIEPHKPSDPKNPCSECVLAVGLLSCLDRSYCEFKETGMSWKKQKAIMGIKWIECPGYDYYINLFIGDECITLIRDKPTIALIKKNIERKKQQPPISEPLIDHGDKLSGFARAYTCDFCGAGDDERCKC